MCMCMGQPLPRMLHGMTAVPCGQVLWWVLWLTMPALASVCKVCKVPVRWPDLR